MSNDEFLDETGLSAHLWCP